MSAQDVWVEPELNVSKVPKRAKSVSGKITGIKTRVRNGHKWLEVIIDIDAKGENVYLYKADVGSVRRYAEQRGVNVQDLVGAEITVEI